MAETLLVLGASLYQVPIIRRAKELGYRVVTTDYLPNNPGHALADAAHAIDTTDAERVLLLAQQEKIGGIIAACTDVAVPTAAVVAQKLGLRGPSWRAAAILCDKIAFREWQSKEGLPAPAWVAIERGALPSSWPGDGAWLVKPARASGSKGVFVVRTPEELASRATFEHGDRAILESFVPGVQLTCEGFLRSGSPERAWVTRRDTAEPPYVATSGHRLPSGLSEADERAVIAAVVDLLARLDVRDGPFDADVVWDDRATVLEATPRLGGNALSELFRVATGFDFVTAAITHAMGGDAKLDARAVTPSAVVLLGVTEAGVLRYDERGAEKLRKEPWVASLVLDKGIGDRVEPFIDGRKRVGEAIISAPDLDARIADLRRRLALGVVR
jgi:biotin carboxylase